MAKKKQMEVLPGLLPEDKTITDNKSTAGRTTVIHPYSGYDSVYDVYSIIVVGLSKNDVPSNPIYPDFEPNDFNVKTTHNQVSGQGGALQDMQCRASRFAQNPRIVSAFVKRERDGKTWQVDANHNVTVTDEGQRIFVFGSNRQGIHGKGAAADAVAQHGAIYGKGEGLQGCSYAIPTKETPMKRLEIVDIMEGVARFIAFAKKRSDLAFEVTRIGCGLAGYQDADIAPLFVDAPPNCHLPDGWRDFELNTVEEN